jgi:uncharacterized protein YbbK (DUF523 family)
MVGTLVVVANADRPVVLVSACLLGVACNHRGQASPSKAVEDLGTRARLVPVCPEASGGLPTPRPAAELQPDGRVMSATGIDVTDQYRRGAAHAVEVAKATGVSSAVLKARSPSCGCYQVYDGTFSRALRAGEGVTAAALRASGIDVRSDEDLERAGPTIGGSGA